MHRYCPSSLAGNSIFLDGFLKLVDYPVSKEILLYKIVPYNMTKSMLRNFKDFFHGSESGLTSRILIETNTL